MGYLHFTAKVDGTERNCVLAYEDGRWVQSIVSSRSDLEQLGSPTMEAYYALVRTAGYDPNRYNLGGLAQEIVTRNLRQIKRYLRSLERPPQFVTEGVFLAVWAAIAAGSSYDLANGGNYARMAIEQVDKSSFAQKGDAAKDEDAKQSTDSKQGRVPRGLSQTIDGIVLGLAVVGGAMRTSRIIQKSKIKANRRKYLRQYIRK